MCACKILITWQKQVEIPYDITPIHTEGLGLPKLAQKLSIFEVQTYLNNRNLYSPGLSWLYIYSTVDKCDVIALDLYIIISV